MRPSRYPLFLILLSSACIEAPVAPPAERGMCQVDSDCNASAGAVCDEAICWGAPPAQPYAAVLIPPEGRTDLVRTELPLLSIAADGALPELAFAKPVTIEGRVVVACKESTPEAPCDPARSIAAHIYVTRPSRIPGAPPYVTTFPSVAGAEAGSPSFVLRLPPGQAGEPYDVTVVPLDQTDQNEPTEADAAGPAYLAPPARFTLEATEDRKDLVWELGDLTALRTVRGRVIDAVGDAVAGMRVFAIPSGIPMELAARSSSIGVTDAAGGFTLRIPQSALDHDVIDLVIAPRDPGAAPTLRVRELLVPEPALTEDDTVDVGSFRMPSYGEPQFFTVPVVGIDSGGNKVPIAQAEVGITTYLETVDLRIEATFSAQAYTGDDGNVSLKLIPGSGVENRRYVARVVAPAGSQHASIHALDIDVGATQGGVLEAIRLGNRAVVTGTIVTATGEPAAGTVVTPDLSLAFRWNLEPARRSTVDLLQQPQVVTNQSGDFLLWLDGQLLDMPVRYDLEIRPADPLLPQWTWPDVAPTLRERDADPLDLGRLVLPGASYARGEVVGPDGAPVAGAKVGLYAISQDQTLCETTDWPTGTDSVDCVVPPAYLGPFPSRDDGRVMLVLPDP
jgi:hypothetical protein